MLVLISAILISSASHAAPVQSFKFEKSNAEQTLPDASGTTKFDSLVASYNAGKIPQWSRIEGLWSGRCYIHNAKDTAKANLLVADQNNNSSDGPLFPAAPRFSLIQNASMAADFFDEITSAEKAEILNVVNRDNLSTVAEKDFWRTDNTTGNLSYQLRRSGEYYVSINRIIRGSNPPAADTPVTPPASADDLIKCVNSGKTIDQCIGQSSDSGLATGAIYAACYYFKKLP